MTTFTAAPTLFAPPPIASLPLSLGQDLRVTFNNAPAGVYTAYPAGATVTLVIDTVPPTTGDATIEGYSAIVTIPYTDTDPIPKSVKWRCLVTLPDEIAGELNVVAINGQTVRSDGGR